MHKNKILVICHLEQTVFQKYAAQINYKPHLSKANLLEWQQAIQQIKPKVIIINTEFFTREMMQIWRNCFPEEPLGVVRAGTSLSRCDLDAAKLNSIRILNTPGVNSKYVAKFWHGILAPKNVKAMIKNGLTVTVVHHQGQVLNPELNNMVFTIG